MSDDWETIETYDPRKIIPSLFPGARVTSTSRPSNHPLSRKNPSSVHIDNPNAFDVAPIPGVSYQQFLQRLTDAGYEIGNPLDEASNPSPWATGPHWHGVIVKGPAQEDDWETIPDTSGEVPSQGSSIYTPEQLAQFDKDLQGQLDEETLREGSRGFGPEPVPGGSRLENIGAALTTPGITDEQMKWLSDHGFTDNIASKVLFGVISGGLSFNNAVMEAIRGTPLEGLSMAFPLGGLEAGGPAALGRVPKRTRGVPEEGVVQYAPDDPTSLGEAPGIIGRVTDEGPVLQDNIPATPREIVRGREPEFLVPANDADSLSAQIPEGFTPQTVAGDIPVPLNENAPDMVFPRDEGIEALANRAVYSANPDEKMAGESYWMSRQVLDDPFNEQISDEILKEVAVNANHIAEQHRGTPVGELHAAARDNVIEAWRLRQEGSQQAQAANTDSLIPADKLTDNALERDAINKADIAHDIGFNDERRWANPRSKEYKAWLEEVEAAELRRNEAQRRLFDTLSDKELEAAAKDPSWYGQVAQQVRDLRNIPDETLFFEDPNKTGGSGPGEPPETPSSKLLDLIRKSENEVKRQNQERSDERKVRLARMMEARKTSEGQEGFHQELSALKGQMPTRTLDNALNELSQDDLNGLFNQIRDSKLLPFEAIRARTGLQRILEGRLPRQNEIDLLNQVFGKELTDKLVELTPSDPGHIPGQGEMFAQGETLSTGPMRYLDPEPKPVDPNKFIDDPKQGDLFREKPRFTKGGGKGGGGGSGPSGSRGHRYSALDVLNLPRAIMASVDFSALLRQGAFLVSRPEFWRAAPDLAKAFFSKKHYDTLMDSIQSRPSFGAMQEAKIAFTDLGEDLLKREEDFASRIAEKIPGVAASGRSYAGFLNKLRADIFDSFAKSYEQAGINLASDPEALRRVGNYINAATGRGELPKTIQGWQPFLNAMLFSPRLMASRVRLLDPTYLVRTAAKDPVLAKQMLRDYVGFGAVVATALATAKMAGADIETDPRSSDFAKIKDGNTRHDVLAGFQQYIRLASQIATGETKTLKGDIRELGKGYKADTELDKVITFFRSKGSPIATFIADYLAGSNVVGEPFEVQKAVLERLTPLSLGGFYDAYEDRGLEGVLKSLDSLLGVGVQTFDPRKPKKSAEAVAPAVVPQDVSGMSDTSDGDWETIQ